MKQHNRPVLHNAYLQPCVEHNILNASYPVLAFTAVMISSLFQSSQPD